MKTPWMQSGIGFSAFVMANCLLMIGAIASAPLVSNWINADQPHVSAIAMFANYSTVTTGQGNRHFQQKDDQKKNESCKSSEESWQDYINRLHESNALSDKLKALWEAGNPIQLTQKKSITRIKTEERTREILMSRNRIEQRDGERVVVPVTELVEQTYVVNVPYLEEVESTLKIPAKGRLPDDAVNEGLQFKIENSPATVVPEPASEAHQKQIDRLEELSDKLPTESWDDYVARLHKMQIVSDGQLEKWLAGKKLKVGLTIDVDFRVEKITREVAVTQMQTIEVEGIEVTRPITRNVTRTKMVLRKVDETIEAMMSLPIRGTQPENSETSGFLFRDDRQLETKIKSRSPIVHFRG